MSILKTSYYLTLPDPHTGKRIVLTKRGRFPSVKAAHMAAWERVEVRPVRGRYILAHPDLFKIPSNRI